MTFSANPFDQTGTLDTENVNRPTSTYPSLDSNQDVSSVVAAFTDATLATDAANRTLLGQYIPSPMAP